MIEFVRVRLIAHAPKQNRAIQYRIQTYTIPRNHLNDSTARKARRIELRVATEERRSAMQGLDCRLKSEQSPIMARTSHPPKSEMSLSGKVHAVVSSDTSKHRKINRPILFCSRLKL